MIDKFFSPKQLLPPTAVTNPPRKVWVRPPDAEARAAALPLGTDEDAAPRPRSFVQNAVSVASSMFAAATQWTDFERLGTRSCNEASQALNLHICITKTAKILVKNSSCSCTWCRVAHRTKTDPLYADTLVPLSNPKIGSTDLNHLMCLLRSSKYQFLNDATHSFIQSIFRTYATVVKTTMGNIRPSQSSQE